MKGKILKPVIFEYDNYRSFLKALYDCLKSEKNFFSFRQFSKKAGYRSPNFLKLVIDGKRNISPTSIEKFSQVLKLNKEEVTFFRNLVLLNQSKTVEEKKFYAEQLIRSRLYRKVYPLKKSEFAYYAHWYFIPIRELVAVEGFQENPEWISRQLIPSIMASEAKRALQELEKLGLIQRNAEGKLVQTEDYITTGDEVSSTSVEQFHREMIRKGSEALDHVLPEDRDISSVTLGLSEEGAKKSKELIQRFRKELMAIASQDSKPERVYQINFQFFALSNRKKNKSKGDTL